MLRTNLPTAAFFCRLPVFGLSSSTVFGIKCPLTVTGRPGGLIDPCEEPDDVEFVEDEVDEDANDDDDADEFELDDDDDPVDDEDVEFEEFVEAAETSSGILMLTGEVLLVGTPSPQNNFFPNVQLQKFFGWL